VRFQHGTMNADGRLDMCKQGFRNAFEQVSEAVVEDGKLETNVRFQHGTMNADGRLDMCKQGFRNAFEQVSEAVVEDGKLETNVRFQHGTMNADGRLDMCKQGFRNAFEHVSNAVVTDGSCARLSQPVDAGPSRQSPRQPMIKHYLIGNNKIGENDTDGKRIRALARTISLRPDIVTWFIAGNSIDATQIQPIARALEHTQAKYIWLKMNPIKTGAYHMAVAFAKNPSLELLDLFNCGLCNEGLQALNRGFAEASRVLHLEDGVSSLKHLYLSINNIDDGALLVEAFRHCPQLVSYYIGTNPVGDDQFAIFVNGMLDEMRLRTGVATLRRLHLGSMGLTDRSLPGLIALVRAIPSLISLELSSYKSTNYFGQAHNDFQDCKLLTELGAAIRQNAAGLGVPLETYLGFQHCFNGDAEALEELKASLYDTLKLNINAIQYGVTRIECKRTISAIKQEEDTGMPRDQIDEAADDSRGLFLKQPGVSHDSMREILNPYPAVDHIKSIYRTTMKLGS
jgi:hypothetical protein